MPYPNLLNVSAKSGGRVNKIEKIGSKSYEKIGSENKIEKVRSKIY